MDVQVAASKIDVRSGKYLSFKLADEVYAVEIARVRQIIAMVPITPVPQTPAFISGVINLRGKIVPVVDLRAKFAMSHRGFTRETCVVIVEVTALAGAIWLGVIVDSMCEVFDVTAAEIEAVP